MMHLRGLVLFLVCLSGGARRRIHIDNSHRNAKQRNSRLGNGLELSAEMREGLIPGDLGIGAYQHPGPRAGVLRGGPSQAGWRAGDLRPHRVARAFRSGPRRGRVGLQAASGHEEDHLPLEEEEPRPRRGASSPARAALTSSRRGVLSGAAASAAAAAAPVAADSLTDKPFDWTFAYGRASADASPKSKGLALGEVAKILQRDIAERKYIITGDLTASIFDDGCRFVDPNNAVNGLAKYRQALSLLFRPELSNVEDVRVAPGIADRTIEADYVAYGVLKLPWKPRILPWRGHIVYTLSDEGLIVSQIDKWNISRWDAIRQTFTPGSAQ